MAGVSSYAAAVQIDSRYRSGRLRNPLTDRPFRKPPVLDQHRKYILANQRRWKALNLQERAAIINEKFVCVLHDAPRLYCRFCNGAVHVGPQTLGRWYKKEGVIWGIAPYSLGVNYSEEEML